MFKWRGYLRIFVLVSIVLGGCSSDDDNPGPIPGFLISDLVGNWQATVADFTSTTANPVLQRDVIADGGTGTLIVTSDGRFTMVISPVGENPQVTTGQFSSNNNLLEVVLDADPNTVLIWGLQLPTNMVQLQATFEHDFVGDGSFQPATADLNFIPQ